MPCFLEWLTARVTMQNLHYAIKKMRRNLNELSLRQTLMSLTNRIPWRALRSVYRRYSLWWLTFRKLGLPSLGFPKDKNKVIGALISLRLSLAPSLAVFFSFSLSFSVCLITVSHSSSWGDGSRHIVHVCWGQNEEKYTQLRLRTHCSSSLFSPMENFIILCPFSQFRQEYRSLSGRKWFWVGGVYL